MTLKCSFCFSNIFLLVKNILINLFKEGFFCIKMVNQDIFGALKWAIARGQSLQEAMISLLNAGYNRQEIEEAAKILQSGQAPQQQPSQQLSPQQLIQQPQQTSQKIISQNVPQQTSLQQQPIQQPQQNSQKIVSQVPQQKTIQKVSDYSERKKSNKNKFFVISLIVILIFLLGLLIVTILFKNQIADILASMG
jgi:hypothetical protein